MSEVHAAFGVVVSQPGAARWQRRVGDVVGAAILVGHHHHHLLAHQLVVGDVTARRR